jgi:hypothetical protein
VAQHPHQSEVMAVTVVWLRHRGPLRPAPRELSHELLSMPGMAHGVDIFDWFKRENSEWTKVAP